MQTKAVVCVAVAVLFSPLLVSESPAASRNCSPQEKADGNAQLLAIQDDATRKNSLIDHHMPFGVHVGTHASQGSANNEDLLAQKAYILLHDSDLRTGLWVSYKLTRADIEGAEGKDRVNCFRMDPRLTKEKTATKTDYEEPIYDRGHLANDSDVKDVVIEQVNTYVLSNMSPQHCRFNRGIWLSLEHLGRIWAEKYETIYITSGAIFDFNPRDARDRDNSAGRMGSRNQKARVAIPSDYYKIFLRKEGQNWHSIAFILENNNAENGVTWNEIRPIAEASINSLEAIEGRAETEFHPNLSRSQLVQSSDGGNWDFEVGKGNLEKGC